MTSGYHSPQQLRRGLPLAARVDTTDAEPADPKPCWITLNQPAAGYVLAWHTDPTGRWRATLTLDLDASRITPR